MDHGRREPAWSVWVSGCERPLQRGSKVVVLSRQAPQRVVFIDMDDVVIGRLGDAGEVVEVPDAHVVFLAGVGEPVEGVLTNGLEQSVPAVSVQLVGYDEGLFDEIADQVEHARGVDVVARAHGACGIEGEAAREDGEASEHATRWLSEEVVTPLDRGCHGLLARHGATGPTNEERQAGVEPSRYLRRRQCPHPCRGELNGQWDPVKFATD